MRIDSHVHVRAPARGDYDWLATDSPIHRDLGLAELRPLLAGIDRVVLVQAAATEAETGYILDVARASAGLVAGVVGWTDLADRDAPDRVAALAADPLLRGLRPMLQDVADTRWILRSDVQPGLSAMAEAGLRLDLLVRLRHLPLLPELAQRHPDLPMVIDHAAKPAIGGEWQPWAGDIATAARETHVSCKLSGLLTEAGPGGTAAALRPYVEHLLDCFGPSRLMWGSDWPVLTLRASYDRWLSVAQALVPASAHDAVFGGNARAFYGP